MRKFRASAACCALLAVALGILGFPSWSLAQSGGPRVIQRGPAPAGPSLVLEPAMALPVGAEARYVAVHTATVEVLEASGVFEGLGTDATETTAVWVRYTVLSPDPRTGAPRVLAEAVRIDPETYVPLETAPLSVTYVLSDGQARVQQASRDSSDYNPLIAPHWLAGWSYTPAEELPSQPITPGFTWEASPDRLLAEGFTRELDTVTPLAGVFYAWLDSPEAGVRAAHIAESAEGSRAAQEPVLGDICADVFLDTVVYSEFWLVPGDFPLQAIRGAEALTQTVIEESESSLAAYFAGRSRQYNAWEWYIVRWLGEDLIPPRRPADEAAVRDSAGLLPAAAPVDTPSDDGVDTRSEHGDESFILRPGQAVFGALGPASVYIQGRYADLYGFEGAAGQEAVVRLESRDFDALVYLLDDEGDVLAYDDDSAGGTNALIQQALPYTGNYLVMVTSVFPGETGSYVLSVAGAGSAPDIDFDRIVALVNRLRSPSQMSDAELMETEAALYALLELTQEELLERFARTLAP